MSPMEAAEIKEELTAALDAISVKSMIDFRGRLEVPRPVESVAAASVALIAHVDESADHSSGSVAPRSWAAAQAAMAKPGHFINSLRRFPYAVDSGRMPDADVHAARFCLQDVSPEHLASEPAALNLHKWVVAALRYCEVQQQRALIVTNNLASPQPGFADGAQMSSFLSTPPLSPPRADEGSPNRNVHSRIARSFPDLAPKTETPPASTKTDIGPGSSIKVKILAARGLPTDHGLTGFMEYGPYCVCEIVNREGSKVQTNYTGRSTEPVFNEEFDIPGYHRGDTLLFAVYDKEMWPKSDVFIGKAELKLLPEGFDGELPLQDTAEGVTASVRIHITPPGMQGRQSGTPGTSAAAPGGRMSTGSSMSRRPRSPAVSPVPAAASQTPSTSSPVRSGRTSGASAMTPKATGLSQASRRPAPASQASRFSAAPARPSTSSTGSLRITPSASPASTRKSPGRSPMASMVSRRPISSPGPPTTGPGYSTHEEQFRKLEQMRREAREMKSKEAHIKWTMKREEEKLRKSEAKEAVIDHLSLQQGFRRGIQEYARDRATEAKTNLLRESRDFQEFKRSAKLIDKEVDQRWIKEEYAETKENSTYVTDLARTLPLEEQKIKVEENLERYRVFAEHHLEEQQREKIDYMEAELARQGAEIDLQLLKAKQEHDAALQSLEYIRDTQQFAPRAEKHLPTRPFTPLNRGL